MVISVRADLGVEMVPETFIVMPPYTAPRHPQDVYTGGDFICLINGERVSCVESLVYSVDTTQNNGATIDRIAGNLLLSQYGEHPLYHDIFKGRYKHLCDIPAVQIIIVAINKHGYSSMFKLKDVKFTHETNSVSANDLGMSVGVAFKALSVTPWHKVTIVENEFKGSKDTVTLKVDRSADAKAAVLTHLLRDETVLYITKRPIWRVSTSGIGGKLLQLTLGDSLSSLRGYSIDTVIVDIGGPLFDSEKWDVTPLLSKHTRVMEYF